MTYILNTNTDVFHLPGCGSVNRMSEHNKQEFTGARKEVTAAGFRPCGNCNP
ncbi:Ada metal-binding domain-containing protein [Collinsella sp. An7]|nr:Ada metal-binding domain-containing protein [Collinsella sp. An7]